MLSVHRSISSPEPPLLLSVTPVAVKKDRGSAGNEIVHRFIVFVWTGENDSNMLRMTLIFLKRRKNLGFVGVDRTSQNVYICM